jgi:hypothetical protein
MKNVAIVCIRLGESFALSAFALDRFGCGVYTFLPGAAGAMSLHDPLEGTEIIYAVLL